MSNSLNRITDENATVLLCTTAGVYGFVSSIDRKIVDHPLSGSFDAVCTASLYGVGGLIIGQCSPDKNLTVIASVITSIAICKELYRFFTE